jgi:glucose-6-phosphate isomerase
MGTITNPEVTFLGTTLLGTPVQKLTRTIGDLKGLFADQNAFEQQNANQIVYEVESYHPVAEGTEGGLFFGITRIQSGTIGNEYMMTKGHSHVIENRAEFYWCIEGEGMLLFMDKDRNVQAEKMFQGSLHCIQGHMAHRVANTGASVLSFGACWPSDAGHNYEVIAKNGFAKRLIRVNGEPQLI